MTQKDERPGVANTEAPYSERNDTNDENTETDVDCKERVMARQRLIDADETQHETFSTMSPHARLLQVFMRCHADKRGRLVENTYALKNKIFPSDNEISVSNLLDELTRNGYIQRYTQNNNKYIQITDWTLQHPHIREAESKIPDSDGVVHPHVGQSLVLAPGQHSASTGPALGEHSASTRPAPGQHSASPAVRVIDQDPDPDLHPPHARGGVRLDLEDITAQGHDLQAEIRRTIMVFSKKGKSPPPQPSEIAQFEKNLPKRLKGVKPESQISELRRRVDILFGENCPDWVWKDKKGNELTRIDMGKIVAIESIWDALGVGDVKKPAGAEQPTGFVGGQQFFGKGGTS